MLLGFAAGACASCFQPPAGSCLARSGPTATAPTRRAVLATMSLQQKRGPNKQKRRESLIRDMEAMSPRAQPTGRWEDDPATPLALAAVRAGDERKARDVTALRVGHLTSATNFFVNMVGNSKAQINAIVKNVEDTAAEMGRVGSRQGKAPSGWVCLDYDDVVVNVFSEEQKNFYALDKFWHAAENINLEGILVPNMAGADDKWTDDADADGDDWLLGDDDWELDDDDWALPPVEAPPPAQARAGAELKDLEEEEETWEEVDDDDDEPLPLGARSGGGEGGGSAAQPSMQELLRQLSKRAASEVESDVAAEAAATEAAEAEARAAADAAAAARAEREAAEAAAEEAAAAEAEADFALGDDELRALIERVEFDVEDEIDDEDAVQLDGEDPGDGAAGSGGWRSFMQEDGLLGDDGEDIFEGGQWSEGKMDAMDNDDADIEDDVALR